MLRRMPTTADGKVVDRLQESIRVNRPFKPPTLQAAIDRTQLQRKRKRVSYKGQQNNDSDNDSDEGSRKKKRKKNDQNYSNEEELLDSIKKYPVFKPKPFDQMTRRFSMPEMRNKAGEVVAHLPSNISLGIRPQAKIIPRPLHDPMQDHAIVLYDPTIDDRETEEEKREREKDEAKVKAAQEAKEKSAGLYNPHKSLKEMLGETKNKIKVDKVPVVIDPRLSKVLRPHQVEGVKFLYKCTTGMMVDNQYGCIMADEMGLGKTLQCITLLWTLLKQSPHPGKSSVEKCVIACPSSLVKNWANELVKWLGNDAINVLAVDGKGGKAVLLEKVAQWVAAGGRNVIQPVMIVSYETLRTLTVYLANCKIGLLLCDEGHRLKNSESLTFQALNSLDVKRRVILTGTPIQNDLSEYFSLLNFANPNFLGSKNDFRKNFENTIIRGRDAMASDAVKAECERKLKELGGLVTKFIIRRTNDLLSKYLPVKYEHVVFCGLSDFQLSLYRLFISSPEIKALLRGADSQPLKAINILKKLCNHPELLDLPKDLHGSEKLIPEGFCGAGSQNKTKSQTVRCDWSGKFLVLERFLHHLRTQTTDKIVLISNYTQTLDLFEKLCRSKKYGYFRLDGTMTITKRQKLVDQFNNPEGKEFVFLLSSKAGGCGINLIGANRLILFDPDWNPAADQQALARVWRDGQKKECFVYRFISTGTIEEKIFQRQANKQALSSAVVDEEDTERHFSLDALRQLFLFKEDTLSETHETFKCKRCKNGKQIIKAPALLYGDASTWNHFTNEELRNNHDDLLRAEPLEVDDANHVVNLMPSGTKRAHGESTPKESKKTRILDPEEDPANFAEEVDSALERTTRRGGVKDEGGYESDSSDDGEGVVYSRRKGENEDEDEDMFSEKKKTEEEPANKKESYLRLGDIEGQEFANSGSESESSEGEPEDEDDAERRKKAGMGFEMSAFNMREEMEEGKFTEDGNYVRSFDQHAIHDRWMDDVDEKAMKAARRRKRHQDRIQKQKMEAEEKELEESGGKYAQELQLLQLLKKGETTLEALTRLGHSNKSSKVDDIAKITHLASNIMSLGETEIYSKTYEELVRSMRASGAVDAAWIPPSADKQFEYKWVGGDEIFGPFNEQEMYSWQKASYFGVAGEKVSVREVGGEWGTWPEILT